MAQASEYIPVGKISGVFGVKGWVKVFSFTEPRDNILEYAPLYVQRHGDWVPIAVNGGQLQGKAVVMSIDQVTDRNQAMTLIGSELAIKRSQLLDTEEDEFYWADLIGLTVINVDDEVLGTVDHLLETGANDVLVVNAPETDKQYLIPFVLEQIVLKVDLDNKQIRVDWQADYL